jgi:hypothetical protein
MNGYKAVQFFMVGLTIPAALVTAAIVTTIFGIVVSTVECYEQAKKFNRQVAFSNSPHMQLAQFLKENPPSSMSPSRKEQNNACEKFMLGLFDMLQPFHPEDPEFYKLKAMAEVAHIKDKKAQLFAEYISLEDDDPKKDKLLDQISGLSQRQTALWEEYPSTRIRSNTHSPEALYEDLYNRAALFLGVSFREEYYSEESKSIELQNLVGVTMGKEFEGQLMIALSKRSLNNKANDIVNTFAQLDAKAGRKMIIHGIAISICIFTIVSLGLTLAALFGATGIPLAVIAVLFVVILVAGIINSFVLARKFNEKSFVDSLSPEMLACDLPEVAPDHPLDYMPEDEVATIKGPSRRKEGRVEVDPLRRKKARKRRRKPIHADFDPLVLSPHTARRLSAGGA